MPCFNDQLSKFCSVRDVFILKIVLQVKKESSESRRFNHIYRLIKGSDKETIVSYFPHLIIPNDEVQQVTFENFLGKWKTRPSQIHRVFCRCVDFASRFWELVLPALLMAKTNILSSMCFLQMGSQSSVGCGCRKMVSHWFDFQGGLRLGPGITCQQAIPILKMATYLQILQVVFVPSALDPRSKKCRMS